MIKRFLCVFFSFLLAFSLFPLSAFAGAVAVPVSAELIGELLVALGLMAGNATSGYSWISRDNPYIDSIFESQISGITSGVPVSSETLGELKNTVIPDDVYTTDGTDFFVAGKIVTVSDVFLNAKSLVGVSYAIPTNLEGAYSVSGLASGNDGLYRICWKLASSAIGQDYYLFPYVISENNSYILNCGVNIVSNANNTANFKIFYSPSGEIYEYTSPRQIKEYLQITAQNISLKSYSWTTQPVVSYNPGEVVLPLIDRNFEYVLVAGSGSFSPASSTGVSLLHTRGDPVSSLQGNKEQLDGAIVQVKPSEDDDNNGSTPPVPQSPNNWEIWRGIADLTDFLTNGTITNGGTTFEKFVNNNYNYVDVDINVPDSVDVNISGGLDITGSGDINVNVNENISVPSVEGDGGKFYNLTLWDALRAVAIDNPMIGTVSALIQSIDPTLVALCSLSLSLIIVLAIWRFLRGG